DNEIPSPAAHRFRLVKGQDQCEEAIEKIRNQKKTAPGDIFGFREAIAKVPHLWYSHDPFPLTPALSLREREHDRQSIRQAEPLGAFARPSLVLPLPEGEGWDEGERVLEIADRGSFAIGSPPSYFFGLRPSDFGFRVSAAFSQHAVISM